MKSFLKTRLWPVVAGLLAAFIVMMIFEFINSLFFPLPTGLDIYDPATVKAFTASLPLQAFVLVLLGWALGAFKAGCVTTYLSKNRTPKLALIAGVILTGLGIVNHFMIGHPLWFNIVGLPLFIIFAYLGHRYMLKMKPGRFN
jgi:hypothetical protein